MVAIQKEDKAKYKAIFRLPNEKKTKAFRGTTLNF